MDAFETYFRSVKANDNGVISAREAVSFFNKFGLQVHVVAQVWNCAKHNKDNSLTRDEFIGALKLISMAQSGHHLTPELVEKVLHSQESEQIPAPEIKMTPTASPLSSPANPSLAVESPDFTNPSGGSTPVSSQEMMIWPKFTADDIIRYSRIFKDVVKDNNGRVTEAQATELFQIWQLPSDIIKHIWEISDLNKNGELMKKEFFIALYLIDRHFENCLLPIGLPSTVLEDEMLLQATGLGTYGGLDQGDTMMSGGTMEEPSPMHELDMSTLSSAWSMEAERDLCAKLMEANGEIMKLKKENYEESLKRKEVETNAIQAQQKVMAMLVEYNKEVEKRKQLVKDNNILRHQRDAYQKQLQEAYERTITWGKQIGDSQHNDDKVSNELKNLRFLFDSLQEQCNKLQLQHDFAVRDADEQRKKREQMNCEFTYAELCEATQNFNASMKLGEGGFGCVYKGILRNTHVAIKKLNKENTQGRAQFDKEVEILSKVRHPNLVTLIGANSEACALVYEFLPNGSLEDRLNNSPPLSWQDRTRIIGEICNALLFLHKFKPRPIVHGDLKPANVLLDASFVSKIGDFGISHLLSESSSNNTAIYYTSKPMGTREYVDPEYIRHGELTAQSDIYSLGILILRVLTGKSPRGIVKLVEDALSNDTLHRIVDNSAGQWPFVQAKVLAELGLECTNTTRKNRPSLEDKVWRMIEPLMKAASRHSSILALDGSSIPPYFICPIKHEVMMDPQFAADGFTYEATEIKEWLLHHKTSPMTNLPLAHYNVTPNLALRSAIQQYIQEYQLPTLHPSS